MNRFLCTLALGVSLSLGAFADWTSFRDPKGLYRVDMPGHPTTRGTKVGRTAEYMTGRSHADGVGIIVLGPHTRYALMKLVEKEAEIDFKSAGTRETTVGGRPALHVTGISSGDGVPFSALLIGGKPESLVVVARGYDLAAQRRVLASLRVLK